MSKLNIDQKTIMELFADKKADFLIPDYQRPYAWEKEKECETLWEDVFSFAFPNDNCNDFNSDSDEYFLGPIVTFKNDNGKMEVIDGQQRLTTLMLLIRAFYDKFAYMQDENSKKTRENLAKCIWKTDEFGTPDKSKLKIDSQVATDNEKEEFLSILKNGVVSTGMKSKYAQNYKFFQDKIADFISRFPTYTAQLPTRIINNCILLPIEAESQDTALRIFSTLNDRGLPLSDADIFKAQFYKYYGSKGIKDTFIERWKRLEETANSIFHPISGTPMDELFTRYMYYERALLGIKSSTTESLRRFYEKDKYALLKKDETLDNLELLAKFWEDITKQDEERFSNEILRLLFVLNYAPNGMWYYFTSVYFLKNRDNEGKLEETAFAAFLRLTIAFVWGYSFTNPGVNALRTPVYQEMIHIVNSETVDFKEFKFDGQKVKTLIENYQFTNGRPITKSMLIWWAFENANQDILPLDSVLEIEHIYAKKRNENNPLQSQSNLERLGNKAFLEKRINIRASDYRFEDKKKYYEGFATSKNQIKEGTKNVELLELATQKTDYTEYDIQSRDSLIIESFIEYLKLNNLLES